MHTYNNTHTLNKKKKKKKNLIQPTSFMHVIHRGDDRHIFLFHICYRFNGNNFFLSPFVARKRRLAENADFV